MKILVKLRFWAFQQKSTIENFRLSCLIKEVPFPIWTALYRQKFFMLWSVQKFYLFSDLINMITRIGLLLIPMKKQGSECVHFISPLKKNFGKHFKIFHTFADASNEFIFTYYCIILPLCKIFVTYFSAVFAILLSSIAAFY